jgi:membrane-associated protease RseP (regulator of RpoE activity)
MIHLALFIATCFTTWLAGGAVFAATLMAILVTHEMGHYVTARRHGIDVSLPYFIPLPFVGIGTMGAVIRMRSPIQHRNQLVDVGASGPLAGLAVALPLLVIGLVQSPVGPTPPGEAAFVEGNSILYFLLKLAIKGQILPGHGVDVQLGPMATAAWVGLLVTFINLIPIGQLDGGHVAAALFGDRHERVAGWLHRGLAVVGVVVALLLANEARAAGRAPAAALLYGVEGALPWLVWIILILVMRRFSGGRYHPPVGDDALTRGRRVVCWVVAVAFVLLFTPVPMREAL